MYYYELLANFCTIDVKQICIEAENKKKNNVKWQDYYKDFTKKIISVEAAMQSLSSTLHALRSRPATETELQMINIAFMTTPLSTMAFNIAAINDPQKNVLDYDVGRLISFINAQNKFPREKTSTMLIESESNFSMLLFYASKLIIDSLEQPQGAFDLPPFFVPVSDVTITGNMLISRLIVFYCNDLSRSM